MSSIFAFWFPGGGEERVTHVIWKYKTTQASDQLRLRVVTDKNFNHSFVAVTNADVDKYSNSQYLFALGLPAPGSKWMLDSFSITHIAKLRHFRNKNKNISWVTDSDADFFRTILGLLKCSAHFAPKKIYLFLRNLF